MDEGYYRRVWKYGSWSDRTPVVLRNNECGTIVGKWRAGADDTDMVVRRCVRCRRLWDNMGNA